MFFKEPQNCKKIEYYPEGPISPKSSKSKRTRTRFVLQYLGCITLATTRVELIFTYDHGNFMLEPSLLKSNWTNFWVNFSRGLDLLEFQANNEILSGSSLNSKLGSKTNEVQVNLDLRKILKIFFDSHQNSLNQEFCLQVV